MMLNMDEANQARPSNDDKDFKIPASPVLGVDHVLDTFTSQQ